MSVFLGSSLEAAHDAARLAYPIDIVGTHDAVPDGDIMALRAPVLEYGPRVIALAEAVAMGPLVREANDGIQKIEEVLALEAAIRWIKPGDQGE